LSKERQHEGAYEEAMTHFQSALRTLERWRGPTDISLAEVLDRLGDLARRQKDFATAEATFRRALMLREQR
jgi:tetratricopeptide (TPR) repeat protein